MDEPTLKLAKLVEEVKRGTITFEVASQEMIRLEDSGDIYVKGKLMENDKEVVEGMRDFLRAAGWIT